jgi:hypothetical protein
VRLVAPQALLEVGDLESDRSVVALGFAPEIDPVPRRIPRPPVQEPRQVVQEVAVDRAAPIDDRADAIAGNQHVVVEEVAVEQVALLGAGVDERLELRERLVEWA